MEAQKILIEPAAWCAEAARMLEKAARPHPVEIYREMIESGAVLFRASGADGRALVYWLLRIDESPEGREGVIVAAGGAAGFDLVAALLPVVEGQFSGVKSIRAHTARPGAAKKILRHPGWRVSEIILRKAL